MGARVGLVGLEALVGVGEHMGVVAMEAGHRIAIVVPHQDSSTCLGAPDVLGSSRLQFLLQLVGLCFHVDMPMHWTLLGRVVGPLQYPCIRKLQAKP